LNVSKEIPNALNGWRKDIADPLLTSYYHALGKPLFRFEGDIVKRAKALFELDCAVLAHDTEIDPIFSYANKTALDIFGYTWEELINLPSRMSAEQDLQEKRAEAMLTVSRQGHIEGYSGIRICKSGRRFAIENATIWNLTTNSCAPMGQAATFSSYKFVKSTERI